MPDLQLPPAALSVSELLRRLHELERAAVPVLFIPPDRSSYVAGCGFRVAVLIAGEDSYRLTGNWPYEGRPDQTMPWFWGHSFDKAQAIAAEHNKRLGLSSAEAHLLVARSILRGRRAARGTT